jgi:hypothetical protein
VSAKASMRLMFLTACALPVFAATAYAAPKPVAPPHSHHNAVHPVAWPGASSATKSVQSTSIVSASATAPAPPPVRRAARVTVVFRTANGPVAPSTPQRPARRARARPAIHGPVRPAGWQDAAGLSQLRSAANSSRSALLLAAGFALLLLVIAETTFLGFAGSRLGVAPAKRPVRRPVRRGPPEEPFPIRRVQLRR